MVLYTKPTNMRENIVLVMSWSWLSQHILT